jgi:hypothetical protein
MRQEFLDQLPSSIPAGRIVLIVANERSTDGLKYIRPLVDECNREGEWVRLDMRSSASEIKINEKIALVLIMQGVDNGSVSHLRSRAKGVATDFIGMSATMQEIKTALKTLSSRRQVAVQPPVNGSSSHNGSGRPAVVDRRTLLNGSSAPLGTISAPEITTRVEPPEEKPSVIGELEAQFQAIEMATEEHNKAKAALNAADQKFGLAVMLALETVKKAVAENASLREQMASKDGRYTILENENSRLKLENGRLNEIVGKFEAILPSRRT